MASIPNLNFAKWSQGTENEKAEFVKELGAAYTDIGFITIRNHGFGEEVQDELYHKASEFFGLEKSIKAAYEIDGLASQRGYTSFGKEHAKGNEAADLKEFWQVGQPNPAYEGPEYHNNVSVAELPEFAPSFKLAYQQLEGIGRELLKAIAVYLELDINYFESWVQGGNSILRAIHYPPITIDPGNSVRAGQHEDINLITLLMGASAEGLQVLNKNNEWIGITAIPGSLVVNVGDMLQRLTNGVMKSTTHRVVNPPREKWGTSRYSIPFFLHPVGKMPLNALSNCISDERTKAFEDITAGDYLEQRLIEIGLKK
ncbi:isopenicillin N synthase family oxygenase [Schleiferiaceae bacterium]|jgi:isopenicillin N synthase-like dioxygenase|nr:isopenicillin N synthase family oxygenase [Schleiferiaceae bacterium]